jgi:hypothetical protein
MNSREQFLTSVNHKQTNRVVMDLGSSAVTGIHVQTISKLRRHFGLQRKPIRIIEPQQMLGDVGWELIDSIGIDVIGAWAKNNAFGFNNHAPYKEWKTPWGQRVMVPLNFYTSNNENGDLLIHPNGDNTVQACASMPKSDYTFKPIVPKGEAKHHSKPTLGLINNEELEHWKVEVDKAYFSGKAVLADFCGLVIEQSNITPANIDKQLETALANLSSVYNLVGNKLNAVLISKPTCAKYSGNCISKQFNKEFKAYFKQINAWIHDNTDWKTFIHCCGTKVEDLENAVRTGFDIVNSGQTDAKTAKEEFGKDLVFWGGAVDTQKILPFGTPKEVREQVLHNCEIFAKDGGFIFNPMHNIPANVPVENMVAMLEALKEFNGR